ncbi:hypothetical protein ACLOJK_032110 [Asimina triloba]
MSPILSLVLFFSCIPFSYSFQPLLPSTNLTEKCGRIQLPFPFHITNSCSSKAFRLSCINSSTLYVNLGSQIFQVLEILPNYLIIDIPTSTSCHRLFDVNSFTLGGNQFYGVSDGNLLRLYNCEDSSICKVECEQLRFKGCRKNESYSCCYPLSDRSVWEFGDGFSVFKQFGCRRFESWVVGSGMKLVRRGMKIEWAIPRGSPEGVCAHNAMLVNSTAVKEGVRCACKTGFFGDGFASGIGCVQSCIKDGRITYGGDCHGHRHIKRKSVILAGILISASSLATIAIYYTLRRRWVRGSMWGADPSHPQSIAAFRKACKTRLFTCKELHRATKGFDDDQKFLSGDGETFHAGVLDDGSLVAVDKIQCESEQDLLRVLVRAEFLAAISHKNIARLLGCCFGSDQTLLVVYEFFSGGTLDAYLRRERGKCLDWCQRMSIAVEAADALAHLQFDVSPPVYLRDFKSGDVFLDHDYSVKISGFRMLKPTPNSVFSSCEGFQGKSDVYSFGIVLMEMITGLRHDDLPALALQKMRDGKLDEIVDPVLCYRGCSSWREQIDRVADVAARCLALEGGGRLCMVEVAEELMHIAMADVESTRRGSSLEETFSTSSLLQMISMSPDSLHMHSMESEKL